MKLKRIGPKRCPNDGTLLDWGSGDFGCCPLCGDEWADHSADQRDPSGLPVTPGAA